MLPTQPVDRLPNIGAKAHSTIRSVFRNTPLSSLADAEVEVRSVSSMYPPERTRVYTRAEATENAFKNEAPGFNVFLVQGDRLSTPRHDILEGITRATVSGATTCGGSEVGKGMGGSISGRAGMRRAACAKHEVPSAAFLRRPQAAGRAAQTGLLRACLRFSSSFCFCSACSRSRRWLRASNRTRESRALVRAVSRAASVGLASRKRSTSGI